LNISLNTAIPPVDQAIDAFIKSNKKLVGQFKIFTVFFSVKLSLKTVEFVNTLEGSKQPEILNPRCGENL